MDRNRHLRSLRIQRSLHLRHQRDNMQRRITNVWQSSKAWTVLFSEREKKCCVLVSFLLFKTVFLYFVCLSLHLGDLGS